MSSIKPKRSEIQCLVALPFNHYFEEEIKRIRKEYNIPEKWDEAIYWYGNHAETYGHEKKQKGILGATLPLDKEILVLLVRFGLPLTGFTHVLYYVVFNTKTFLDPSWATTPIVNTKLHCEQGLMELKVNVSRINIWTTKEQWIRIWSRDIKPSLDTLKEEYKEKLGIVAPGRKSASPELMLGQMKRWSEWYHLSETEQLGPVEALRQWEINHPEESGKYDQSTAIKAIAKFREIITPISIKDIENMNF